MKKSFDYIIVGAGTAGCVLAERLSAGGTHSVLVVEAGAADKPTVLAMPLGWFKAFTNPRFGWGYISEPEPFADLRRIPAPRGKVVGGCSSINGMMYSRGHQADYDGWAAQGLAGWDFAGVLPYFIKSEANWRGESAYHGASGPMTVARHQSDDYVYPRLIATAEKLGHRHLDDFHGAQQEGFSAPDFTVHRGRRGSTARRYLHPALERPNLVLATKALTTRILIEHERAIGIEYIQDGQLHQVRAEREVILAGGAFNSPQLLLLSGIGPAAHLHQLGIPVVRDLPGVGSNLQEHASIPALYEASGSFTFDAQLRLDRMLRSVLRWQLFGTGPVAALPVGAQGFVKSRPELALPDIQTLISPVAMDSRLWFPGWRKARGDVFTISSVLLRPSSRGTVRLRSNDPAQAPAIQLNLLQTQDDRESLRRAVRMVREFFNTEPAAGMVTRAVYPDDGAQSDEQIDAYVRANVRTAMHPTSTCAMGTGPDAVVDGALRVHGIAGLRVVDASVMPNIIGGNTQAPTIMIAEKASELILGRVAQARYQDELAQEISL